MDEVTKIALGTFAGLERQLREYRQPETGGWGTTPARVTADVVALIADRVRRAEETWAKMRGLQDLIERMNRVGAMGPEHPELRRRAEVVTTLALTPPRWLQ